MNNPNSHTVVSTKSYGKRIMESFGGVLFGIVLFFGSFAVLFNNEGRVDVSEVAKNAVPASAEEVLSEVDGQFVYVTGTVSSEEIIGDNLFLNEGDYLAVKRTVEMYSWVETTSEQTESNMGGSETTTTTYDYSTEWTSNVPDSGSFYDSSYFNPTKLYENESYRVNDAKMGVYSLNFNNLTLPGFDDLALNEDVVNLSGDDEELIGGYIYIPYSYSDYSDPEVGDVRVSYQVLKNNADGTIFAKTNGESLETYYDDSTEVSLYRFFDGGRDQALKKMHGEYQMMLWLFRALGFIMMWVGLSAVFRPISVLLDVVPLFGSLSKGIIGIITGLIALVLSVVTILVSMILHNIVALIVAVLITCFVIAYVIKKKGNKPKVIKA